MIVMHDSLENTYITYFTSQFPSRHRRICGESSVFLAHVPLQSHLGLFHLLPNPTTLSSLYLLFQPFRPYLRCRRLQAQQPFLDELQKKLRIRVPKLQL